MRFALIHRLRLLYYETTTICDKCVSRKILISSRDQFSPKNRFDKSTFRGVVSENPLLLILLSEQCRLIVPWSFSIIIFRSTLRIILRSKLSYGHFSISTPSTICKLLVINGRKSTTRWLLWSRDDENRLPIIIISLWSCHRETVVLFHQSLTAILATYAPNTV